jgi:dCTP deaminase
LTVLSDSQILKSLKKGEIKLEPNDLSTCLNPAGYDLRSLKTVTIKPKEYELVATLETVELDLNIVAFMHIRSSLAREGIIGSFAVIDPGFRGQLTLHLQNVSNKEIKIKEKERIVQIVFHNLSGKANKGYNGSYQNSKGVVTSKRNHK